VIYCFVLQKDTLTVSGSRIWGESLQSQMARLTHLLPYERTMSGRTVYTGTLTYPGTLPRIELFWPVRNSIRKDAAGNGLTTHSYTNVRELSWLMARPRICFYDKCL
jgi:hypothetical protein